jgi:hypothetical protein
MSSVPATTDLLLEIRDRTDESCPYLGTLLGLVALAEGVLRIAAPKDGAACGAEEEATLDAVETSEDRRAQVAADAGLTIALGAVALSQHLVASCAAASRLEIAGEPATSEAVSAAGVMDDPWWCDALV